MAAPHDPRPWQARLPFYYGWIIATVGFIASVFGIGLTWAAGLLAVPMSDELHWSRSAFFFGVSLRGWLGIVATPLMGPYLDRPNGPRILSVAGGVINTVSLSLIAFVDSEWQFLVLFGIVGAVAQAAQGGISAAIVPKWFVAQRGTAVAISTLGGGIAAIALPPLLAALNGAAGWRASWLAIGVLAFVLGTLPAFLLRRQPEDLGLLPDGRNPDESVHLSGAGHGKVWTNEAPSFTLEEALRTNAFWVLMVGIAVGSVANNGIPASLAPIFVDRGFPFQLAAGALVAYGLASTTAKISLGWITNRVSLRSVLLALTLYGALALSSILLLPSGVGPYAYAFLVGVYIGGYFPLSQMVWAEYFGRAHVGAISALGRPLGLAVGASGPFLLAFTRDATGSYDLGILLNALSAILCFACLLLVRPASRPVRGKADAATVGTPT